MIVPDENLDFDYIVIGSGFGGSVSACRLAEKGYRVGVMEMGRHWSIEDFPGSDWDARRFIWRPGLRMFGFYNLRVFRHMVVMCGNAVGGGSIAYANALLVPSPKVWEQGSWAGLKDWAAVMPQHYATAERMLGVTDNKLLGEADRRLKQMADMVGVGHTYYPGRVGTFFAPAGEAGGKAYPDPYFGGEGPDRGTCVGCGGCMVGCKYNAKNTLDKNYLYFAQKHGARIFAETRVVDVRPLNGMPDGCDGYEIHTESSTALFNRQRRRFSCRGVVFAASSLGTVELMLRLRQSGSLPRISDDLGKRIRTNAESLLGMRFPAGSTSLSQGVAGGAAIYLDEQTHIGVVRYPEGSGAASLLLTLMRSGRTGWGRIPSWLWSLVRHPLNALRGHNPLGFARQTMLFVVMQTLDAHVDLQLRRRWYWPFSQLLSSEGAPIPTHIPHANEFIERGAKALGGIPLSLLTEILFNIPTTAHCMGGCAMADSAERGVMDAQNRVFGYENLLVCDGSMLSANLGVNPSLTITALTEHAMSSIPAKSDRDTILSGSSMTKPPVTETNLLAQPLHLPNGAVLRNRLAKSSMSETLGTYDNHATPILSTLYRRWAASGIGLLLTGNVMIDRRALGEPGNVVIEDESDLPILQQWARAATDQGAALWVQLNHPGKQSPKGLNATNLSPSAIPFRQDMAAFFETPREITPAQIQDIIQRFGRSAAICRKAGFSGVQIHGAHGYLVSQFLSPHHNQRTDEWGGSPQNRRRFVMAVYAEIRRQVGADFPVGIKLNSADFQRGGFTEDESMATIEALVAAGIDLIEISGGTYETPAMSGAFQQPKKATTMAREAYFLEFAEKVRAAVQVPLMVTGGFRTAEGMNAALRSGALDIVGLARLLAIDPDAPAALLQGRDSQQRVRPIVTGIKPIDRMGLMEVLWYTRQLRRIAEGGNPRAAESGLAAFLKSFISSQWGTYQTRRLRA